MMAVNPSDLVIISVVRLSIAVMWLLAPAVLLVLAVLEWRRTIGAGLRTTVIPVAVALAVLADWVCFLVLLARGSIGGFGTHYVTTRMISWFLLPSLILSALAITAKVARGKLMLASLLVFGLWFGSGIVA